MSEEIPTKPWGAKAKDPLTESQRPWWRRMLFDQEFSLIEMVLFAAAVLMVWSAIP